MTTDYAHQPRSGIPDPYTSPPITIILTVIFLVFFFVGFFCIYFCRCFMQNLLYTMHLRQSPTSTPLAAAGSGGNGLDPSVINCFPTFTYSSVKNYRKEKYGLECAICLVEFEDSDMLRLLTSCCHVFHQECIDLWLESHKTCPVCRRNLETPLKSPEKSPVGTPNAMHDIHEDESLDDRVVITIKDETLDDEHEREPNGVEERECGGTSEQVAGEENKLEKFSRSHSTGHSIVKTDHQQDEEDKFTLILPEDVKAKIIRAHKSQSCTTFGEFRSRTTSGNGGFAEVSEIADKSTGAT